MTTSGFVLSAFFYGYLLTQLIGGYLSTILGSKSANSIQKTLTHKGVLGFGVTLWSLFTILNAPSASIVTLLILARVVIGLGEGVTLPSIHHMNSRWFSNYDFRMFK